MTKPLEITKQRFGSSVAIRPSGKDNRQRMIWEFECDCGKIFNEKISNIQRSKHKSCGCKIQVGPSIKYKFNDYKNKAIKRGLSFKLSYIQFSKLITNKCYYCGNNGDSKIHARDKFGYCGIDRTNNDIGYTKNNCVSCCKKCNFIKRNLKYSDFLNQVNKIYNAHYMDK